MVLVRAPAQQIIDACDRIKPKLSAGEYVTDSSPCGNCRDVMRGNCNSYGGCIYMDWQPSETYVPDTTVREQGVREMIQIGPSDGLPYLLTRSHRDIKGFDEYLGRIMRGWGVHLEYLARIMHDTGNTPLVRMHALYVAKRDERSRHRTDLFIPELRDLSQTADQTVAAYARESRREIEAIREWQNGEYRNLRNRAIIGTLIALGIHAGISSLFVGTSADGTTTTYSQALMQVGPIKDGLSGFIGACFAFVGPPTDIPEPFNQGSDW